MIRGGIFAILTDMPESYEPPFDPSSFAPEYTYVPSRSIIGDATGSGHEYYRPEIRNFTFRESLWFLRDRPLDDIDNEILDLVVDMKNNIQDDGSLFDGYGASEKSMNDCMAALEERNPDILRDKDTEPLGLRAEVYMKMIGETSGFSDTETEELTKGFLDRFHLNQDLPKDTFIQIMIQELHTFCDRKGNAAAEEFLKANKKKNND